MTAPPGPAPPPAPSPPTLLSEEHRRLNPLTPAALAVRMVGVFAVTGLTALQRRSMHGGPDYTPIIIGSVGAVIVIGGFVSWLVTRYWAEHGELRVDSGLLRRQSKRLRLDRLQSVDVMEPLSARLFGLAELRVTTAGAEQSTIRLRYLRADVARAMRAELLGRAAGLGPGIVEAPERPLVVVPPGALVGSAILDLFSWRGLFLVAGPVLGATAAAFGASQDGSRVAVGAAGGFVITLFSLGPDLWRRLNTMWRFTVAESPDGLRLRSGLLSTQAHTVPPGRIQALRITQPAVWRPFGWAAVHMNVAGYVGARQAHNRILLPVAPIGVARALIERVLSDPARGEVRIDAVPVTRPPRRAWVCAPLRWRWMAAGSDDRIFVSRHGMLARRVDIVPNERTQSVRLVAGPWQRLFHLASVHLDSTRGAVRIRVPHRDDGEGRAIVDVQATRARHARSATTADDWMRARAPREPG